MDLREHRRFQGLRHPWELERLRAAEDILRVTGLPRGISVLDVGSGDGYATERIHAHFGASHTVGVDTGFREADRPASREQGGIAFLPSLEQLRGERFDLLLLLDVLEHVEQDLRLVLRLSEEHLKPGGWVLITVPAFPSLWSRHDRWLGHLRRYRLRDLVRIAAAADLRAKRSGYLFSSLLAVRTLQVLAEKTGPARIEAEPRGISGWKRGRTPTAAVRALLRAENTVLLRLAGAGFRLPGLSAWILCQKS